MGSIAGIANPEGNVIGLMPHPERIYYDYFSSLENGGITAGKAFFDSLVAYSRAL